MPGMGIGDSSYNAYNPYYGQQQTQNQGLNAQYQYGSMLGQQQYGQQSQLQAAQLQSQRSLADVNNQSAERIAGGQNATQIQQSQIQADAAKYPYMLKNQHWNQLFPVVQGAAANNGGGGTAYNLKDALGGQPTINAGPIWNPQQIQAQTNLARGSNDATTAGNIKQMQAGVAGRGFGANSPLAQALATNMQGQNLAANSANDTNVRWNAAQGNAQAQYEGQVSREQQFNNRLNQQLQQNQIYSNNYGALLSALSSTA